MKIRELKNILQFEYDHKAVVYSSAFIIIVSVAFAAIAGWKALIALVAPVLIWAVYKSYMNLLWIFLAVQPVMIYFSATVSNLMSYLLALVFVSLWLSRSFLNDFKKFRVSRELSWLTISFVFISLISIIPGGLTRGEIYSFVRIIILFSFVFAFYDSFLPKDITKIFIALSIPVALNGIEILRIFLSTVSIIDFLTLLRMKVGGLLPNANQAGYMFLIVTPFWIALLIWRRSLKVKVFSALISFLMLMGLLLTSARASILGIIVSIFFFTLWKKKLKYFMGAVLLVLIVIYSSSAIRDLFSVVARVDRGVTSRDVVWANTFKIIEDNWMFGIGIGNYSKTYAPYIVLAWEKGFFKSMSHAHNLIISKTAELGILGFIWVLFFYIIPAKTGYDVLKIVKTDRDKAIAYGILAMFFGLYAQSLFEAGGMLQEARFTPDAFFWIIFAALLKTKDLHDRSGSELFAET
jgi:O-antigen ligase